MGDVVRQSWAGTALVLYLVLVELLLLRPEQALLRSFRLQSRPRRRDRMFSRWPRCVHLLCLYIFGGWFIVSILDRDLHRLACVDSQRSFFPRTFSHLCRVLDGQVWNHIAFWVSLADTDARLRQSVKFLYVRPMVLWVHIIVLGIIWF